MTIPETPIVALSFSVIEKAVSDLGARVGKRVP